MYYFWIFSFSELEKTQVSCFEGMNACCEQKKREKVGVGEEHKLSYCLWGGKTGLEVTIASF